ncbi:hypothetical protein EHZ19_24860 [Paraburkholderia bannensis]|nr:hypothetical protein [Paraburkholderia bannensis]RQM45205.1 hypothetical protein EHZ19_24860 [Paraburkholderia bannensis]
MPDLNRRRAWAGSLAFTAVSSLVVFLLFGLPSLSGTGHLKVAQVVIFSLAVGLGLEGARRLKLVQLRRELAAASDTNVVNVGINGVSVGQITEPVYADMRLACATDPRNYVAAFSDLLKAMVWHAALTFLVMTAFGGLYALACCLLTPVDLAQALLALTAFLKAHADNAAAIGAAIHMAAVTLVNIFLFLYLLLAGARMTFTSGPSLLNAFSNDLHRRIRMMLDVPVTGNVSLRRTRAE